MTRHWNTCLLAPLLLLAAVATAQDSNVVRPVAELEQRLNEMPFEILKAEKARGIAEDVALKSEVRFADGVELRIKIRPANYGGSEFNNEPRYELAAYVLQKALLDEPDRVIPPTALRAIPHAQLAPFSPMPATFRGADDVVAVVQYWLKNVNGPKDAWDPARFAREPGYAHHVANVNVVTYLIAHGDSNAGNILVSTDPDNPRVFDIDNGIAFGSPKSDRGTLWGEMRVPRVPKETVQRLREFDRARLQALLAAVATWEVRDKHLVAVAEASAFRGDKGARTSSGKYQLGLTAREISDVEKRRERLLQMVDSGKLATF